MKSLLSPAYAVLMIVLACHTLPLRAAADLDPQDLFEQGQRYYQQSDYTEAKTLFERLVRLAPGISTYYHWLGKCYGRLAENSGWISAVSFSRKTLDALKKAVELDGDNTAALQDLMTYYRQAPAFLGGSSKQAEIIANRLQKLQAHENRKPDPETAGNVN